MVGRRTICKALIVLSCLLFPTLAMAQVVNNPPVADAGPDQTIYLGDSVTLYGSAYDPDGHMFEISEYRKD